ncbi:Uncharacterized protein dnm_072980 [Desulfonema magnum]|uniref:Cytosolic protein n=1 Tax=Desulfonema magnum TaxID=45655 RepID=A0A975BSZ2_9BACT|nr:Uncharacterized protein dnm_072980 [Desulfonema magnum]
MTDEKTQDQYDSPWKELLERYFREFLEFFFPDAAEGIDWQRGHEFLDKEFQQAVRDAELGKRLADNWQRCGRRTGMRRGCWRIPKFRESTSRVFPSGCLCIITGFLTATGSRW